MPVSSYEEYQGTSHLSKPIQQLDVPRFDPVGGQTLTGIPGLWGFGGGPPDPQITVAERLPTNSILIRGITMIVDHHTAIDQAGVQLHFFSDANFWNVDLDINSYVGSWHVSRPHQFFLGSPGANRGYGISTHDNNPLVGFAFHNVAIPYVTVDGIMRFIIAPLTQRIQTGADDLLELRFYFQPMGPAS